MVEYVKAMVGQYLPEEREGQGLVEYALILVLIAVAAIAIMTQLGGAVQSVFSTVVGALGGA